MPQIFSSERPAQRKASATPAAQQPGADSLSSLRASADRSPAQRRLGDLQQMAAQRMEEEDMMQGKAKAGGLEAPLQRMEDEDTFQGQAAEGGLTVQRQESAAGPSADGGLPGNLRAGIETLSGMDMSDVQVHYNSSKPAQLNAHAYAQGSDIHLASGQEQHLGHEAWHVVQQKQGRVAPTMELGGVSINDDAGLEAEADQMGARALQTKPKEPF